MLPLRAQDPPTVGVYRLIGRLGAGGMGQVYLAVGHGGIPVAVKVVHARLAHDMHFRSRFRREVEIGRRVVGPWTAAVVDADPTAPVPWLATEYVPGPALEHVVHAVGPLPVTAGHILAAGLARALLDVHGAGVVHRDIKPSNVLLAADRPRLIDFGISRALEGTQVTGTGAVLGTPAFMSPEQAAGDEAGPASDLFSVAAVLVHAMTGHGPFGDGAPLAILLRVADEQPDLSGVPDELRGPVAACLAKAPGDRPTAVELVGLLDPVPAPSPRSWLPAPVAELALDLERVRDSARTEVGGAHTPPAAGPSPDAAGPRRAPGPSRRSVLVGAGLLGLGSAGGLATYLVTGRAPAPAPAPAPVGTRVRWTFETQQYAQAMTATDEFVYVVDDRTLYALDARTGAQRWTALSSTGPDFGYARFALRVMGSLVITDFNGVVTAFDAATGAVRWSLPDLTTTFDDAMERVGITAADGIVYVAFSGEVRAVDGVSGAIRWSQPVAARFQRAPVAGGGRCVATGESALEAFDAVTGRLLWRYNTGRTTSSALAMADGTVFRTEESRTLAVDAATGALLWEATVGLPSAGEWDGIRPATGDGAVYVRDTGGQVHALDAATGAARWVHPDVTATGSSVGAGPVVEEGTVYSGDPNGRVYAVDSRSGVQLWDHFSDANHISNLAAVGGTVYASFGVKGVLGHPDRVEAIEPPAAGPAR